MKVSRTMQFLVGVLALIVMAPAQAADPAAKATVLSSVDQKLLGGLLKQFLFDPKGAQYVRVKTTCRTVWASSLEVSCEGWLVPSPDAKTAKVYFADGENVAVPSPDRIEKLDFVDQCRKRYAEVKKPAARGKDNQAVFERREVTGAWAPCDGGLALPPGRIETGGQGPGGCTTEVRQSH